MRPDSRCQPILKLPGKREDAVRGLSTFRIVPPVAGLSLSELESQFAVRRPVEAAERREIAECYDALRRQYAEQSRRAQLRFADPRIKQSSAAAIFHLAVESVKASRLVYAAIQEAERALRGDSWLTPPEIVERGIDWNSQQLHRLEGQLRLLDLVDGVLPPLKKLFDRLESSRHVSAMGWRSITRHLLSHAAHPANATALLPVPGFSLKTYLSRAGHGLVGDAFAGGIATVLALAPGLAARDEGSSDNDSLAIGALCQDCGVPLLARHRAMRGRPADGEAAWNAHASLGAGLVGGIAELATEVPSLVAQHHRRHSGFDRLADGAMATQQPGSRLLAATVRFLELVDEMAMTSTEERPAAALYPAAVRLIQEADQGEWDPMMVAELITGLGFQLKYEAIEGVGGAHHFGRGAEGNRRLDPAGQAVPDPNFLSASTRRESRYVPMRRG